MLKIKLFAVFAFLGVAAAAVLFSNISIQQAQTSKKDEKRDAVLENIAGYKQWKQLQRPEKKTDEPELILNSSAMG